MDVEIIKLSEVSQTEKDKYHMISLICGILNKNDTEPTNWPHYINHWDTY